MNIYACIYKCIHKCIYTYTFIYLYMCVHTSALIFYSENSFSSNLARQRFPRFRRHICFVKGPVQHLRVSFCLACCSELQCVAV